MFFAIYEVVMINMSREKTTIMEQLNLISDDVADKLRICYGSAFSFTEREQKHFLLNLSSNLYRFFKIIAYP
jgi:hypothetical protein